MLVITSFEAVFRCLIVSSDKAEKSRAASNLASQRVQDGLDALELFYKFGSLGANSISRWEREGGKKERELAATSQEFEFLTQHSCGSPLTELSDFSQ